MPSSLHTPHLDRYTFERELGRGAYGVVWEAIQAGTEQRVAIKLLLLEERQTVEKKAEARARFEREMQLIGQLSDPHVVTLLDSGSTSEGTPYMVLEHIDGRPLDRRLEEGPLSPEDTHRVMLGVLSAVVNAHELGVVHRDLKPSNIMVAGEGARMTGRVLDFGIAGLADQAHVTLEGDSANTITISGQLTGTPSYMPPEQLLDGTTSPPGDVYALGLILLECLTGEMAVDGESTPEICFAQITKPTPIPNTIREGPYGPIIERACNKDPRERFPDAEAMLTALEELTAPESPSFGLLETAELDGAIRLDTDRLTATTVQPERDERSRRERGLVWVAAVLLIVLIGGGVALLSRDDASDEPESAASPSNASSIPLSLRQRWSRDISAAATQGLYGITDTDELLEAFILDAMLRARLARLEGRYEESRAVYRRILKTLPDYAPAHEGIGLTYLAEGRLDDAEAAFTQAIGLDPALEEATYELAHIAELKEELEVARDRYRAYLETMPGGAHVAQAEDALERIDATLKAMKKKSRRSRRKSRKSREKSEPSGSAVKRLKRFE